MTSDLRTTVTFGGEMPIERLVAITREFTYDRDLRRAGVEAAFIEQSAKAGDRGDPITVGAIALALVTSGAVTALIECLKAYFSRERTLVVKITRPDGTVVEVNARNIGDLSTKDALDALTPP